MPSQTFLSFYSTMPPSALGLVFVLILFSFTPSQQQHSLSPSDAAALLDIKNNLRDPPGSNFFASWDLASGDPCFSFSGIICSPDEDGGQYRVSALTLGTGLAGSPGLTGTFPPSITNLTALTELVVYPGHVSGPIPPDIGTHLRQLRLVSISGTLVSGPIPASFTGLEDLHTLDLGHNRLQGPIPPSLVSSNPSLRVLILESNGGLYGDIPTDISASQLLHLDLCQNSFTGSLPQLPFTLRYLSVSTNVMTGPLDAALATPPPDLAYLDLSLNAFTGSIPPAIFSLPSLSSILLQCNNLSGPVIVRPPSAASEEPEWVVVDLSHNMLTGEAPAGLAGAASLYLNDNQMTGAVPADYARNAWAGRMTTFYAQRNFLTAFSSPLPLPLPDSVSLCLSYNCMVPPPAATAGCVASPDAEQRRPASECHNTAG